AVIVTWRSMPCRSANGAPDTGYRNYNEDPTWGSLLSAGRARRREPDRARQRAPPETDPDPLDCLSHAHCGHPDGKVEAAQHLGFNTQHTTQRGVDRRRGGPHVAGVVIL